MTLSALQHLVRSAQALAEGREILVLGSASLLASFPELGSPRSPLAATFYADLCPTPFDELTATMLDEALGEGRAYYRIHGYHADILCESVLETLPGAWRNRLVPGPETAGASALDPHDLAAVKLQLGRPKDLALIRELHSGSLFQATTVRERLDLLNLTVESAPRVLASFQSIFQA